MTATESTDAPRTGKRTLVAAALVLAVFALAVLLELVVLVVQLLVGDLRDGWALVVGLVATQASFLLVALLFYRSVLEPGFVSLARPTRRQLSVVLLAVPVALSADALRQLAVEISALEGAGTLPVEDDIAVGAVIAILALTVFVAPVAEELFFRGVIQRYVAEASSTSIGVAVATVLFVPVHGLGILATAPNAPAAVAVVATLAAVSVVLGVAYARTDNLVVPIAIHAGYNALLPVVTVAIQEAPLVVTP